MESERTIQTHCGYGNFSYFIKCHAAAFCVAAHLHTNSNTTVYQAIKESINTVAVKCLDDYGVNNSISFLKENFDSK